MPRFPAGVQVCRDAFCKLLGVGSWRLVRTRQNFKGEDRRKYGVLAENIGTTPSQQTMFLNFDDKFLTQLQAHGPVMISVIL